MSRKDLRNGKESGRWKPSKWRPARVSRKRRNALGHARLVLSSDVGEYQANLVMAEVNALIDAAISRAALHAAGLLTIGE